MADNLADNFDQAWRRLLLTKITTKKSNYAFLYVRNTGPHTIAGAIA